MEYVATCAICGKDEYDCTCECNTNFPNAMAVRWIYSPDQVGEDLAAYIAKLQQIAFAAEIVKQI
jgi:hypothetical protein